mgnify:CR=1 FL=1
MKPRLVRLVALLALTASLVGLFFWWRSDRRRIVAQFETLQDELEKSGDEGTIDRLGHARGVSEIFVEGFVIRAQPYEGTIEDRQQLMAVVDRYRASAERITVSDSEVEKIVRHLKEQGVPEYLEEITAEPEESEDGTVFDKSAMGEEGGDLYERAVAIVLRDKKASTSYVQRRLQIGYNRAASLIERMEMEGVISAPNHAGKREILAGGGAD